MSKDGYILLGSSETTTAGAAHTFTNIPIGYNSLTIRGNIQSNEAAFNSWVQMRVNGYSGADYDTWRNYVDANGSVIADWRLADNVGDVARTGGNYLGNWPAQIETTFFGVSDGNVYTKWITVFGWSGGLGGYGSAGCIGGVLKNTTPVTSLSITLNYGLMAYTVTNLYGRRS